MIGGTRIAAESCCSCDACVQVGSSEEDPRDGLVLWCSEEEFVFLFVCCLCYVCFPSFLVCLSAVLVLLIDLFICSLF